LYDPRRDLWTQLPDTPGGGEWVGTVGDSYVVVSPANGEAYRIPVPSVSTAAEVTWSKLPDLPERSDDYFGGNVTMLGERIVVAGTGVDRTGVWQLSDGAWQALPRLPLSSIPTSPAPSQQDPPEQPRILHTAVATVDGALYAFVAVSFAEPTRAGVDLESHVLRLTGNEWVERPLPSGLPAIVQHAEGVSSTLFLTGTNCPPYGSCPFNITPPMGLFDPVTDEYTDRSKPGFLDIARIGDAIVGYDAFTRSPGDNSVKPGDTAALDTYSKQWLDAPASEPLRNFAAAVGTPYGFIVLDAQAGGFILRPAE
jgi:hypothetical protein